MNAYACVSYGTFFSTLGSPITSLRPSRSRSAIDGGDAVHCSHAWRDGCGHSPTWRCRWSSSTFGLSQRMNWPQPSRRPANSLCRFVYHGDASTDVPSWLKTLIWWLSNVTTTSFCGSSSRFPIPTFSP